MFRLVKMSFKPLTSYYASDVMESLTSMRTTTSIRYLIKAEYEVDTNIVPEQDFS